MAILAGSRVTMPYGLGVLATGLMRQCFREHRGTLGEAVLAAKQAVLPERAGDDPQRAMLDGVAAAISPDPKLRAAERVEHVLLMNLLGDPLLRLHYAQEIALDVPARAVAGTRLTVSGLAAGRAGHRGVERATRPPHVRGPSSRRLSAHVAGVGPVPGDLYARNDRRLATLRVPLPAGRFEVQLAVPECEPGVPGDDVRRGAGGLCLGRGRGGPGSSPLKRGATAGLSSSAWVERTQEHCWASQQWHPAAHKSTAGRASSGTRRASSGTRRVARWPPALFCRPLTLPSPTRGEGNQPACSRGEGTVCRKRPPLSYQPCLVKRHQFRSMRKAKACPLPLSSETIMRR